MLFSFVSSFTFQLCFPSLDLSAVFVFCHFPLIMSLRVRHTSVFSSYFIYFFRSPLVFFLRSEYTYISIDSTYIGRCRLHQDMLCISFSKARRKLDINCSW